MFPANEPLRITVLGSGTSVGVPTVGCHCEVCRSQDPRDQRLRPSILLRYSGKTVLIDTTPDFRSQALRAGIERLDAILFTHAHADHIMGLDDVRPFNFRQKGNIPIYASAETIASIRRRFDYIFDDREKESSVPRLELHVLDGSPFELFGLQFTPIPIRHGRSLVHGFRFGNAAYLTDHSDIPEASLEKLRGLDVLFLDALRHRPHPTHSTVERSLGYAELLGPARTYFTHICHDLPHARTESALPPHVRLAYDGLEITVGQKSRTKPKVRIYRSLEEIGGTFGPCALSIGNFDGVHRGHRSIFRGVVEFAGEQGWKPSALTFDPHPTKVVAPERAPRLLTTPEQRCELMAEEGIEQVLILPFTREISELSPEEFVREILAARLGAKAVLVGANFRFGHWQAGDTSVLSRLGEECGFITRVVPPVSARGRTISSSEVRRLIESGNVALAARLLERPHYLEGEVISGHGVGSSKTVPTLNLKTEAEVLPARGVYITRTTDLDDGRAWPSASNIGYRPTFGGSDLSIETFLLAPLDGPSPKRIRVEFLRRLREEKKFESAEALKAQILRDAARARAYFRRLERRR